MLASIIALISLMIPLVTSLIAIPARWSFRRQTVTHIIRFRPYSGSIALWATQTSRGGDSRPSGRRPKSSRSRPALNNNRRRSSSTSSSSGSSRSSGNGDGSNQEGTRLNKCIPSLSRRGADDAISAGLVTVNGNSVNNPGFRVSFGDVVKYEGKTQHWQEGAEAKQRSIGSQRVHEERNFIYLKYWKPRGVTCTSDPSDPTNIITQGGFHLLPQRVFTVGRLDKDSTGLILLTSDGRLNHALLGTKFESGMEGGGGVLHSVKEKVYEVETYPGAPSEQQLDQLREGVVITTEVQKDGSGSRGKQRKVQVKARTLPCTIRRLPPSGCRRGRNNDSGGKEDGPQNASTSNKLEFTLVEGRNRQIRKMVESIGLTVSTLHRTGFANLSLRGISEGNWAELNQKEMQIIEKVISRAVERTETSP